MPTSQIVTMSFFQFKGPQSKWWAFQQMGLSPNLLQSVKGLSFSKMLGSGGGNGFQVWPNLGVYGLLGVWETEAAARAFIESHAFFLALEAHSKEQWTVFLRTATAHGTWDGANPFEGSLIMSDDVPVCVLTRATIKMSKLAQFWRFVPQVSRSVEHQKGRLFSIGVGELPLVQQATFSLWTNAQQMKAYAYESKYHKEVIKRTRALGWYKEELFARFIPFDSIGRWKGQNLLEGINNRQ